MHLTLVSKDMYGDDDQEGLEDFREFTNQFCMVIVFTELFILLRGLVYLVLVYMYSNFYVCQMAKICVFISEMLIAELYYFMDV